MALGVLKLGVRKSGLLSRELLVRPSNVRIYRWRVCKLGRRLDRVYLTALAHLGVSLLGVTKLRLTRSGRRAKRLILQRFDLSVTSADLALQVQVFANRVVEDAHGCGLGRKGCQIQ